MREERTVTLNDGGKDMTFAVKAMSARQLQSWIIRAGLLLVGTGLLDGKNMEAGEMIAEAGKVLMNRGISSLAGIDYQKAQPLIDELLMCCSRTDAGVRQVLTPDAVDAIIQDVRTLFALEKEALSVNLYFFGQGGLFGSRGAEQEPGLTSQPERHRHRISVRS